MGSKSTLCGKFKPGNVVGVYPRTCPLVQPEPYQWREHYRENPSFSGGLYLSRVAFASDYDA